MTLTVELYKCSTFYNTFKIKIIYYETIFEN